MPYKYVSSLSISTFSYLPISVYQCKYIYIRTCKKSIPYSQALRLRIRDSEEVFENRVIKLKSYLTK